VDHERDGGVVVDHQGVLGVYYRLNLVNYRGDCGYGYDYVGDTWN
jgi:hypothetical protein